jgi:type I restriction enzyme S subunit
MRETPQSLPPGWAWTTLGDIADLVGGGTPSRENPDYFTGEIVWLTPTEIPKDCIAIMVDSRERITKIALKESSARLLPKGAVLMTSRATIGYVAIAGTEVTTNQGFASFICSDGIFNGYLAYWLWAQREKFIEQATGTTFKEITKSKLRPIELPLAPLPEQRRIVAKIEELFTRLDAGVKALKRVQAALKRYKASVLKAACEGRLVRARRDAPQQPADEPADKLLARILAERRAKWEADQRARKGASRRTPTKAKYEEPPPPDTDGLPELPVGWVWATIEQLADEGRNSITDGPFGSKLKTEHYTELGPRVIRLQNIGDGEFRDEYAHISERHFQSLRKHEVFAGDLVIAGLGESLPRSCIVPDFVGPAIVKADCIRFKPHPKLAINRYLNAALNSEVAKKSALLIVHGIGRPRMNQQEIKALPIPLPPLSEQRRITAEVERRLSVVAELEKTVTDNLARAGRLRQAILHRAFTGRLVPQDPNDEPAGKLLERIRAGRGEAPVRPHTTRRKAKGAA